MDKVQMVCKTCGSPEVRRNADAAWNIETQEWELVVVFQNSTCESCGEETSIIEKAI